MKKNKWLILFLIHTAIITSIVAFTNFRNPLFYYAAGCVGFGLYDMYRLEIK